MASYISKIKVPGVDAAYLIKDNEGRLMIAPAFDSSKSYSSGDYYVKDGKLYVISTAGTAGETTVGAELKSIKQSIAGAMHYIGVTSTKLKDGATKEEFPTLEPTTPGSLTKQQGFVAGDVVLAPASDKTAEKYYEYVFNGDVWSEFGSTMPIGSMAYANSASGSTSITYNKPVYTGGTVEVNDYSEGESKYFVPTTIKSFGDYDTVTLSDVSKNDKYLVTDSIHLIGQGDTSFSVVTGVTSITKRLNTTVAWNPGDTGASAVTDVTTTQKGLATMEICGVESKGISVSKVTGGSKTINVGATQTTSVVSGLGSTAAAAGNNPFVNAIVDANECLSWIEKPLGTTEIREASRQDITVQNLTVEQITGVAKLASDTLTVATGALDDKKTGIITGVTSTSVYGFGRNFSSFTVATGGISDDGLGDTILNDFEIYEMGSNVIDYATGRLSDTEASYYDDFSTGDNIADAINAEPVYGVVVDNGYVSTIDVLVPGTQGEEGAIKVLTGITSTAAFKDVILTKGTDETHSIDVAITVHPDTGSGPGPENPGTDPDKPDPDPENPDPGPGSGPDNPEPGPEGKYLTMTLPEGSPTTQISIKKNGTPVGTNFQYRVNNGAWNNWNFTNSQPISAKENDVIQWKGNNPSGLSTDNSNYIYFDIPNEVHLSGNVMSLIDGVGDADVIPCNYCFNYLFKNTKIKTVAKDLLPATTLADNCYKNMFNGCTSLVNAPSSLPAETLAGSCYFNMFKGCTSLVTAPELPAETLADNCYEYMFNGCTSLVNAPKLPATTLAKECYVCMFQGCSALVNAPELPATNLGFYCYNCMFRRCTSLVNAPELPATTLTNQCYGGMFTGCTSLVSAPALPATTLTFACYYNMFNECSNLQHVTCLATNITATDCTSNWLSGVASTGTFTKAAGVNWPSGGDGIPEGWTVIEQ